MGAEREPESRVEIARTEALQRAAMTTMLGLPGINRDSIPAAWQEEYNYLHRESTPRSGEQVYFEGERLSERRNEHFRKYGTPYWRGVREALEVSYSLGGGLILQSIGTQDKDFLIEKLARAQSGVILLSAGLLRSDLRITQDELEGRIAAFEWALGYRDTTERTPKSQAA